MGNNYLCQCSARVGGNPPIAAQGSAEAAYWRDDTLQKRRPMMEAWGRFRLPAKAAKVIPFGAA